MAAFTEYLQGLGIGERVAVYAAIVALAILIAYALRRITLTERVTQSHGATPGPYAVAYTAGGPQRAVLAALATLRAKEVIAVSDGRTLMAVAAPPAGTGGLERAVYDAVSSRRVPHARDLHRDYAVRDALAATHAELLAAGVLVRPGARVLARLWGLLPLLAVVLLFRAAQPLTTVGLGGPAGPEVFEATIVDFDFAALVAFLAAAFVAAAATLRMLFVPRLTRGARKGLRDLRGRHQHLTSAYSPSFTTYGANDAAMAVALFGPAVLWSAYPDFALMSAHHQARNSATYGSGSGCGGGSSCGSSDSSSGGSSCGGGSSCSSGSSCGGGGGGCGGGS